MSVKPIDYQIAVPRAHEAAKASSEKQQNNIVAQQQSADSVKNKAEADLKQVAKKDTVQQSRIHEKQREEKNSKGNTKENTKDRKQSKKPKQNNCINKKNTVRGSRIDIRI